MVFCAILTQAYNVSQIGFQSTNQFVIQNKTSSTNDSPHWEYRFYQGGGYWFYNNGSSGGQSIPAVSIIGIDGMLALLIGFIALGTALGITIFGTGLSDSSQNVIYKSVFFFAIWGIFSALGCGFNGVGLFSIPVFGSVLYIVITLCYVVGVQSQINTHE